MSGRHSYAATRQERTSRTPVVVIGIVLAAAVVGIAAAMVLRSGSSSKPSPVARANDAAAAADARGAVSTIEQCYADTGRYPSAIDAGTGAVTGCTSGSAALSAGDSIAYFTAPSADGYILAVTNTTAGVSGKAFCYSSQHGGSVVALPSALTAWRAAC